MQLVRQIQVGVDVDGDGAVDLDASAIYYAGQSFGGIYGTMFLGVEPRSRPACRTCRAARSSRSRGSAGFRPLAGIALSRRMPSLLNVAPSARYDSTRTSRCATSRRRSTPCPARWRSRRYSTGTVGAAGRQPGLVRAASASSRSTAAKPVIIQFAKGDRTVPNPTASAILRAGALRRPDHVLPQRPGVRGESGERRRTRTRS